MSKESVFNELAPLLDKINCMIQSHDSYVYRGYNQNNELLPSLIRYENFTLFEKYLFQQFEKYALSYVNITSLTDFILSAQHYGLPTRLLDFTYNPFIAMFFATNRPKEPSLTSKEQSDNDEYYCLRYVAKNDMEILPSLEAGLIWDQIEGNTSTSFSKRTHLGLYQFESKYKENLEKKIVILDANFSNNRILMQQGTFMLPYTLDKKEHLDIIYDNSGVMKIHFSLRDEIRKHLDTLGFNAYRLMPDLPNVCSAIRSDAVKHLNDIIDTYGKIPNQEELSQIISQFQSHATNEG